MPVEWITVDDGLPQGMVRAMWQDRTGYLWFGTKDGLARSDGNAFTVFRHDERDSSSLCGDDITALLEDRSGMLWVGTESSGIDRYDPKTGRFAHVALGPADPPQRLLGIRDLREDQDGNIWSISEHGLLSVIPNGSLMAGSLPAVLARDWGYARFGAIAFDRRGRLWVSSGDSLFIYEDAARAARLWHAGSLTSLWNGKQPGLRLTSFTLDTARSQVLVCLDGVILTLDERTAEPLDTLRVDHYETPIIVDQEGWAWTHFGSTRWTRLHLEDHRIEYVTGEAWADPPDGSPRRPTCWMIDRVGNIWAGTNGYGVLRINTGKRRFNVATLRGRYFASIGRSPRRLVLRGDDLEWSTERQSWEPCPVGVWLKQSRLPASWTSCAVDGEGRYWFLTARAYAGQEELSLNTDVLVLDEKGRLFETQGLGADTRPNEHFAGPGNAMWVLAGDAADQLTMLELLRFNTRTLSVERRYPLPSPWLFRETPSISACLALPGHLLLGTRFGLLDLNTSTGEWKTLLDADDPDATRRCGNVLSLCPDPKDTNTIWVGTHGKGLFRYALTDGTVRRYTQRDGLPNEVVYGILDDAHGNLWCSTNMGLFWFDPRTGAVRTYTVHDGIAGNEFNRYSAAKLADGRMYFAGMDGITSFDPEDFYTEAAPSNTVITGLRLMNKEPGPEERKALRITAPIDRVRTLTLPYHERMITFSFACLDHSAPQKNTYRYRLEGFNEEWVENGTDHEATFTNLDPGTYTFRVQGRNSAGVLDEPGVSMQLTITPPWWGTWWFRIGVVLLVSGLLYAFYRYRLAQAVKLARVRDRIARDLHDEIGSTLSSVALFSEVAKQQGESGAQVRSEVLERISQSTSGMVESMNDIVWAVNSRNDDLLHVVRRMREFGGRMAEAGGFKLDMLQEGFDPDRVLSMTQRKNLYLIFKEAVNNAAKHARCSTLTVRITTDKKALVLRVQDDGVGMEEVEVGEPSLSGGNGRQNMRTRAAEIGGDLSIRSAPGQGTTIELRFPL